MPRIARPVSQEAIRARHALLEHLAKVHLTPNAYAGQCGVGQWTLSRFLNGRTKNITPAMEPALRYARIDWNTGITNPATAADNARLRNALNKVWDGSEETAELLAGMIEALGPVVARCVKHR